MKKLKDFIYNQNDLVVALIIVIVAALVIGGRVSKILDYPSTVFAAVNEAGEAARNETTTPGNQTDHHTAVPDGSGNGDGEPTGNETETGGSGQEPGGETTPVTPTDPDSVTFVIEEGQYGAGLWKQLAMDLKEADVVVDWHDFYDRVSERASEGTLGNHSPGTYILPKGVKKTEDNAAFDRVINILNGTQH